MVELADLLALAAIVWAALGTLVTASWIRSYLQFEELGSAASEDEMRPTLAMAKTPNVAAFAASVLRASRSRSICRVNG